MTIINKNNTNNNHYSNSIININISIDFRAFFQKVSALIYIIGLRKIKSVLVLPFPKQAPINSIIISSNMV